MNIWFLGYPNQMIVPFLRFYDVRELDHFPRGGNKNNWMGNIINILERGSNRVGGR